jgi:hypothetical protein
MGKPWRNEPRDEERNKQTREKNSKRTRANGIQFKLNEFDAS